MHKRTAGQRERVMAVLWSEFLALWFDRTRRRAVPLLLATLLLLIPSLPARSECSCEFSGEGSSLAHHHEEGEAHEHHDEQSEARQHPAGRASTSVANSISAGGGHAHLVAVGQVVSAEPGAVCCSCSRSPLSAVSTVVASPSQANADSQTLVNARVNALSVFRFDSLTGLFGRAGPPPDSKPKLLFLASLPGRAPPVSL